MDGCTGRGAVVVGRDPDGAGCAVVGRGAVLVEGGGVAGRVPVAEPPSWVDIGGRIAVDPAGAALTGGRAVGYDGFTLALGAGREALGTALTGGRAVGYDGFTLALGAGREALGAG